MTNDDGGPAYPQPSTYGADGILVRQGSKGMSKREEYAKAAMHAMIVALASPTGLQNLTRASLATEAFGYADKMLAESRREDNNT